MEKFFFFINDLIETGFLPNVKWQGRFGCFDMLYYIFFSYHVPDYQTRHILNSVLDKDAFVPLFDLRPRHNNIVH